MEPVSYISTQERDIVLLRNKGMPFPVIARKCDMAEKKVINTYLNTLERLHLLMMEQAPIESVFPCDTVSDFLDQMGVPKDHPGRRDLGAAIYLSHRNPELLESLDQKFYPALAGELEGNPDSVGGRIRRAIAYSEEHQSVYDGAHSFFEAEGIIRRHQMVKKFLLAAPAYIRELC